MPQCATGLSGNQLVENRLCDGFRAKGEAQAQRARGKSAREMT